MKRTKAEQSVVAMDETPGPRRLIGMLLAGLVAAGAVFALVPPSVFKTEAVVGIGDPSTPLREAMAEAAAAAAVSKPVMSRAASSLVGTAVAAPAPGFLDRLRVSLNIDRADGRDARLAGTLAGAVGARTGDAPGVVKIIATAADADTSAQIATAVAEALIAEQEVQAVDLRRRQEIVFAREIEGLKAAAQTAHRRFVALGGSTADPAQARAAAANQTAAAQARLDVVRSILASGTPPLTDRHDLPQTVASLQSAYLDLAQQLAKARETLGERHSTVISLQAGLKLAAASLTTEWKRLSKVAESETADARDREAALSATKGPTDPAKKAELDDARRTTMIADDALAQAESARRDGPVDEHAYRLVAQAPVPSQASGLALSSRLLLALLAGVMTMGALRALASVTRVLSSAEPAATLVPAARIEPATSAVRPVSIAEAPIAAGRPPVREPIRREPPAARPAARTPKVAGQAQPIVAPQDQDWLPHGTDHVLNDAMRDLLPALDLVVPQGDLPVVFIGSNEAGTSTTPVALALGTAMADVGLRVLVVETAGTALAAAVEADAEPAIVDVFGTLRVALRADVATRDGSIYLAPTFRNGDRIVAGLARAHQVPCVDDLAAEFDLVIIDAGQATKSLDVSVCADAFLRVGRTASKRADDTFLTTLHASRDAFLGAITASVFAEKSPSAELPVVAHTNRPVVPLATSGSVIRMPVRPATIERRRASAR